MQALGELSEMFQRQLEAVPGLVEEMLEQGEGRIKALFMQQAEQVRERKGRWQARRHAPTRSLPLSPKKTHRL